MKNNIIKYVLVLGCGLLLASCDAKKRALYQEISKLETEANFSILSLANNHKQQLLLLKEIHDKGFFNQTTGDIFTNYYAGSIVKGYDSILFDETKVIKPNKDYIANIIIHLKNLYEGNDPFKYAYITMYESIDWQLKLFRVLPQGAILSVIDKCSAPECQTYYFYVEGLQGVDNQTFKQELILEYKGSFSHSEPMIEITTLPSYKIVKKIKYSTPALISKWVAYTESLKLFSNDKEFLKAAKKNKKLTMEYLEATDKLIEPENYDLETANKYIASYKNMVENLYSYRKVRLEYYISTHPALYKSLSKDRSFVNYPKLYKDNKAKLEALKQEHALILKNLAEIREKINLLKKNA